MKGTLNSNELIRRSEAGVWRAGAWWANDSESWLLGAVRMESYEDRIRDFCTSWNQLFGWLNFGSIDEFEDKYRGAFQYKV